MYEQNELNPSKIESIHAVSKYGRKEKHKHMNLFTPLVQCLELTLKKRKNYKLQTNHIHSIADENENEKDKKCTDSSDWIYSL